MNIPLPLVAQVLQMKCPFLQWYTKTWRSLFCVPHYRLWAPLCNTGCVLYPPFLWLFFNWSCKKTALHYIWRHHHHQNVLFMVKIRKLFYTLVYRETHGGKCRVIQINTKDRIKDHAGAPTLPSSSLPYTSKQKCAFVLKERGLRLYRSVSYVLHYIGSLVIFLCLWRGISSFPVPSFPIDFGQCCEVPGKKNTEQISVLPKTRRFRYL